MADQDVKSLLLQINATTELLRSNLAQAEQAVAKFQGDTQRHLDAVDGRFDRLGVSVGKLKGALVLAGAGAASFVASVAGNGLFRLAKDGLEYAASLGTVAQQLGVTTKDLQEFRFAATQVGLSRDVMDDGLKALTATLGKVAAGAKAPIAALEGLKKGLSAEVQGKDTATAFRLIADALANIASPAQRAAVEMVLFGQAGQKLDALLSGGSSRINDLASAAETLGIVLSDQQIQKADETARKLDAMKTVMEARIAGAVSENADSILKLADALAAVVDWAGQAATAYSKFKNLIPDSVKSGASMVTNPVGWGIGIYRNLTGGQPDRSHVRVPIPDAKPQPTGAISQFLAGAGKHGKTAEQLAREAARAQEKANRDLARFNGEVGRSQIEILNLQSGLTVDFIERNKNTREANEIERQARAEQIKLDNNLTESQKKTLLAANDRVAELKDRQVNFEENRQIERDGLDIAQAAFDDQRDLAAAQGRLADTAKDRLASDLRLLDLQYDHERSVQEQIIASNYETETTKEIARRRLAVLDQLKAADVQSAKRQNAGPGQNLLRDLDPAKINESIEQIKVDGLKGLEDGLVGVLDGTKSVSAAFRDMAQSIIADLARIAIQQAIIKPLANALFGGGSGGGLGGLFGFADGGKVPGYAFGGQIFGPGGPRSDSILAAVSNGEFIVNAEATRKNLALLQAINDNKVPRFAEGGLVSPKIAMPRLPDIRGMGGGRGEPTVHQTFDLRGAVVTEKLYADMQAMADKAATRGAMGGAQMAQDRMKRSATRKLGR